MNSEKEKMLMGHPYKANDIELVKEREFAKSILFDFNNLNPKELSKKIIFL